MASTRGRQLVLSVTNKSGGAVAAGDVVVVDTSNDTAFTTTTTGRAEASVGIAQEAIASNATGRVLVAGYAALVNVPASVTRGHYVETHTVAKQATGNSTRRSGSFGQFFTGGTTPTAWLWGQTDQTASGGAGGITHAYAGYNTIGGSWENVTQNRAYAKKVTLASNCLIASIGAYVREQDKSADSVDDLNVALYSDNSGTPNLIIAYNTNRFDSALLDNAAAGSGAGDARWLHVPLGYWATAGDYWIAVAVHGARPSNGIQIAYDATGTDRYYTASGSPGWFSDWGYYTPTTSANAYSIRASTLT